MITVIGIGNSAGDLTERAKKEIYAADAAAIRTVLSEAGKSVKKDFDANVYKAQLIGMDDIYETAEDFNALNEGIVARLMEMEIRHKKVVYLVDGDGYSDSSVVYLSESTVINILPGVSQVNGKKPTTALTTVSAYDLLELAPVPDAALPLYITAIDSKLMASQVKLYLMRYYGDETDVMFSCGKSNSLIKLFEIDCLKTYNYSTCVFIKADLGISKVRYTFSDLMRIMSRLTAPDGCPWDKEQTHESIRINLIEEAYEAVDAIDSGDSDNMVEELGDVLLQAIFHCDIASRHGEFTLEDVITALCTKLVTRHTHIFGENKAEDSSSALGFWEKAKAKEKNYTSVFDQIDRLPQNFPAMLRCEKTIKKLTKAGYNVLDVIDGFSVLNSDETYKKVEQLEKKATEKDKNARQYDILAPENYKNTENLSIKLLKIVAQMAKQGLNAEVELNSMVKKLIEVAKNEN